MYVNACRSKRIIKVEKKKFEDNNVDQQLQVSLGDNYFKVCVSHVAWWSFCFQYNVGIDMTVLSCALFALLRPDN
jgi:hypothetical protein